MNAQKPQPRHAISKYRSVVTNNVTRQSTSETRRPTVSATTPVGITWRGWGFWAFMRVSVFLGLGYTFYTGAVDAWLVDALQATGYTEPLEPVFALGQMAFGVGMLLGTIGGGLLGQIHLYIPYL